MKRTILFVAFSIFSLQHIVAQQFRLGLGAGAMWQNFPTDSTFRQEGGGIALTISPSVHIPLAKSVAISLDMPISTGFHSITGPLMARANRLALNVPLMLNLNFGAGAVRHKRDTVGAARWATAYKEQRLGFFIGLGFASHYAVDKYETTELDGVSFQTKKYADYYQSQGAIFNIGIRFGVGYHRQRSVEVRYYYMQGTTNEKPSIKGLNCSFVL